MMSIRKSMSRGAILLFVLTAAVLFTAFAASAQMETYQRNYPNSPEEVDRAVHTISAVSRGRLPILDGFVIPQGQPLESFSRGYYECTFQVLPSGSGQAIVRVAAKITAWYTDPEASRSGYRVLPSNGRLENDSLDRIDETLIDPSGSSSSKSSSSSGSGSSSSSGASANSVASRHVGGGISPAANKPTVAPETAPVAAPAASESIDTIRARREANEKKAIELAAEQKNLEEILRNQSHPTDLAIVKKSSTPLYSKPAEGASVLISADAHDEFQMLGVEGAWVHVQISGASRGWLRRSQVNLPASYGTGASADEGKGESAAPIFDVEKEETSAFSGTWEPLRAKTVRVVWLVPAASPGALTSAREKKKFAKEMFVRAYAEDNPAEKHAEGVVVLFDSADGGQVAATMSTLKQLVDGSLSEAAFWAQCSLDPTDLFQDSAKPSVKSSIQKN